MPSCLSLGKVDSAVKEVSKPTPFANATLCCFPRRSELLEFDFSIAVDGLVEDEVKINAGIDEVSDEQIVVVGEHKVIQAAKWVGFV
ncbi:hypothetical protein DVH24_037889 [Malus domestica]|uniref:Uncharacterized protein n=1 Tax=Malus domestica TaxID=3750 RepID=A0A498JYC4_MALDO|nr:hypothetical protein DVH24_037889 [Malus domestica]